MTSVSIAHKAVSVRRERGAHIMPTALEQIAVALNSYHDAQTR